MSQTNPFRALLYPEKYKKCLPATLQQTKRNNWILLPSGGPSHMRSKVVPRNGAAVQESVNLNIWEIPCTNRLNQIDFTRRKVSMLGEGEIWRCISTLVGDQENKINAKSNRTEVIGPYSLEGEEFDKVCVPARDSLLLKRLGQLLPEISRTPEGKNRSF